MTLLEGIQIGKCEAILPGMLIADPVEDGSAAL